MENLFTSFYDLFVEGSLLGDLREQKLVVPLSLAWLIIGLLGAVVFYWVVAVHSNRSKLNYWFLILILTSLLVFVFHLATCVSMQNHQDPRNPTAQPENMTYFFDQGGAVFFVYALEMFVLTAVLFSLFSIPLKFVGNANARKTPF